MLTSTFLHVPGIGSKTEARLWRAGINDWDALTQGLRIPLSPAKQDGLRKHIDASRRHIIEPNPGFFSDQLPPSLHWRLFPEFRHTTAYLDIETTGLGGTYDDITVIGLYDGTSLFHYVMGKNLHEFPEQIARFKVIVTYNGKCFDVPVIERFFRMHMDVTHIDLRHVLRSLGFRGGLKGCERQMGIDRGTLQDMDGYCAVLLWREFIGTGDARALDTLLAYNAHDVVHLETLMVAAYNMKLHETPFRKTHALPIRPEPLIPLLGDREVIERVKAIRNAGPRF